MACKFKVGDTVQWTSHMLGILGSINRQSKFKIANIGTWHDDSTDVDHLSSQYKVGCPGCHLITFTTGQYGWEHYYEIALTNIPLLTAAQVAQIVGNRPAVPVPVSPSYVPKPGAFTPRGILSNMPSNVVKYPEITTKAAHATPLVMNHPCCGWCGHPLMDLYEPRYGMRVGCDVHGVGCPEVKINTKSSRHP